MTSSLAPVSISSMTSNSTPKQTLPFCSYFGEVIYHNSERVPVLLRVSATLKKHHEYSCFYLKKFIVVAHLQWRCLVHYTNGSKQGSMHTGVVLEKSLTGNRSRLQH